MLSFVAGTGFFVWGAYYWAVPTWDVGVSLLMSGLCFLFAPWAIDTGLGAIRSRRPGWIWHLLAACAVVYGIASGSYEIYNTIRMGQHPLTYWWNLAFSIPVTISAGLLWRYPGSLADFLRDVKASKQRIPGKAI